MDPHQQRLMSVLNSVQTQESGENAVANYHMIMDKWLATMAGAWSLGVSPYHVPLPWGAAPPIQPSVQVTQNQPSGSSPEPSRSGLGSIARGMLLAGALLGTGGLGAGATWLVRGEQPKGGTVAPAPTPSDELGYQIRFDDGPWSQWQPLPKE